MSLRRTRAAAFTTTATGSQNDFAVQGAKVLRCNNASDLTLTGIAGGKPGQRLVIVAIGAANVHLAHQSVSSSAANRLINWVTSANLTLVGGSGVAEFVYDAVTQRWRMLFFEQGDWITPTFNAGDYTASGGGGAWTVAAENVSRMDYKVTGVRKLMVIYAVTDTTVVGAANTQLQRVIPGGFTADGETISNAGRIAQGGVFTSGGMVTVSGTTMNFFVDGAGGTNWTAAAGAAVQGHVEAAIQ